jgi:hypothetical protein
LAQEDIKTPLTTASGRQSRTTTMGNKDYLRIAIAMHLLAQVEALKAAQAKEAEIAE